MVSNFTVPVFFPCTLTLDSGIDVGPMFINFGFFFLMFGLAKFYAHIFFIFKHCVTGRSASFRLLRGAQGLNRLSRPGHSF